MSKLLPGLLGAAALVVGVAQVAGAGAAWIAAGVLLLALDNRRA